VEAFEECDMWKLTVLTLAAIAVGALQAAAQATATPADILATVRVPQPVLANGRTLPAGTYDVRLTNERPTPLVGQSPDARRWVEFVAGGVVVAREAAEVLRDDDRPAVGASSRPPRAGTRVDRLEGGDFLRVSVKRGGEQFLIYLPVVR
jgi:hypothetical protein